MALDPANPSAVGLSRLEAQVASDLETTAWPSTAWVKPRTGPDGAPMINVLIVGAGQGGVTLGHQLKRERVDGVVIVDKAPPDQRGPWTTYARMKTLRSPKFTTGPDLDAPNLAFQRWYEAQYGAAAWEALGKIPKETWAAYVHWLERVLGLDVRSGVAATAIRPTPKHVAVDLEGADGERRTVYARHVALATGIETPGRWWAPAFVEALPETLWSHTGDAIDFEALRGKDVAVLGAGASAFDNAATALETGARSVHIFFRRDEIQRVQPYKQISYVGFLRHLADLDDAARWRFMRHLLTLREAFPVETWERATRFENAHLHAGAGWLAAAATPDGRRVSIETAKGPFVADYLICGTGFDIDLSARPELSPFADAVALWSDRHEPPAAERDERLARYPYLGPTLEFLPKDADDADQAAALARVRLFTFGATMSFGPSGSSINALKYAAPRLVSGVTKALFREDAQAHFDDLLAYDTPEF